MKTLAQIAPRTPAADTDAIQGRGTGLEERLFRIESIRVLP
jgi:hypothetical protein